MKYVLFMGHTVEVSDSAKYLYANADGSVWEDTQRPRPGRAGGVWIVDGTADFTAKRVGVSGRPVYVEFEYRTQWKETLAEVAFLRTYVPGAPERLRAYPDTTCNIDYYDGTEPSTTVAVCTLHCEPADATACAAILVDHALCATDLAVVYERALETLASIIDALRAVNATGTAPSQEVH